MPTFSTACGQSAAPSRHAVPNQPSIISLETRLPKPAFPSLEKYDPIPPPAPFNPGSIDRSMTRAPAEKSLQLPIKSADADLELELGYSYDVVKNNTLAGFFSFYASAPKIPSENFNHLAFTPTWGNNKGTRVMRLNGDAAWKISSR
ncbi:unnamed protein product [Diplocarpon coronariae]